jgi:hypothetical protein
MSSKELIWDTTLYPCDYPKEIKKYGFWIYLYEYIDHNFFDGSYESIYLIGKGLEIEEILLERLFEIKNKKF